MPDHNFWNGQRVTVTGGAGFLGSFIVERLAAKGRARDHRAALCGVQPDARRRSEASVL
jgi:nucleoside-diphosphate-sugar epimerase